MRSLRFCNWSIVISRGAKALLGVAIFVVGCAVGYNYGALRNLWDWETGSLEGLNRQMAVDKTKRLALIILTEQGEYQVSRIDPKRYMVRMQILEKVTK